ERLYRTRWRRGLQRSVTGAFTGQVVYVLLQILIGDAVLLELAVESRLTDAEQAGSHQLIAVEMAQRRGNGPLFHLGDGRDLARKRWFGVIESLAVFELGAGVL